MWKMKRRNHFILSLVLILCVRSPVGLLSRALAEDLKRGRGEKRVQTEKKGPEFTFKIPVNAVAVSVKAIDVEGNPIRDLTVRDFRLYEDGKIQAIQTFDIESHKKAISKMEATTPSLVPLDPRSKDASDVLANRFIKLVIDDLTEPSPQDLLRGVKAIEQFVTTSIEPSDQLSFVVTSGTYELPFTSDHKVGIERARELYEKVMLKGSRRSACPSLSNYQAQMITTDRDPEALAVAIAEAMVCTRLTDRTIAERLVRSSARAQFEESQFRNRNLLHTLEQHARALKHLNGTRMLILLSGGFLSHELHSELQTVIDVALRGGVVIHTLDIRGLYSTNTSASERDGSGALNAKLNSKEMSLNQDPLNQLAAETGGTFFHSNNDLFAGIGQIVEGNSHRYVLTYSSPAQQADGRYHKIKVEVDRPGAQLTYRKGYYAQKEQLTYERRSKKELLEALQSAVELNEIPIQLSYEYLWADAGSYELILEARISMVGMPFVTEDQRHRNVINFVVVVFDENDRYVDGLRKTIELNLTEGGYEAVNRHGLRSKAEFRVPPGQYRIRAAVRESVHQRLGSLRKTIEVR